MMNILQRYGLILVMCVSAVVQFAYVFETRDVATHATPLIDAGTYHRQALAMARGQSAPSRPFWQPPMYPLVLAKVYGTAVQEGVTGADLGRLTARARRVQILLALLSAALTYLIAVRIATRTTGLIAGLMMAGYGPLVFFNGQLLPVGLSVFLNVLVVWLVLIALERRSLGWFCLAGTVLGLAVLTVPNVIFFLVVLMAWQVIKTRESGEWRRAGLQSAVFAMGLLAPLLAVLCHNHSVSKQWVLISTNGGINFYIGNSADSDRLECARPGSPEWTDLVGMPHRESVVKESEASAFFYRSSREWMTANPVAAVKRVLLKTWRFAHAREIPRNMDVYVMREQSTVLKFLMWKVGSFAYPFGVLAPLAILGVALRMAKRDTSHILMGFIFVYMVSVVLFFPSARYKLPMIPAMLIFSAIGLQGLWAAYAKGEGCRLRRTGIVLVVATLINLPTGYASDSVNFEAELENAMGAAHVTRGEFGPAIGRFTRAKQLNPEYADARLNLALLWRARGKSGMSQPELIELVKAEVGAAISASPRHARAWNVYGEVLRWEVDDTTNLIARKSLLVEALVAHEKAIEYDPLNVKAHNNAGATCVAMHNDKKALEYFYACGRIDPDFLGGYINIAAVFYAMKNFEKAMEFSEYVLDRAPQNAAAKVILKKARRAYYGPLAVGEFPARGAAISSGLPPAK